MRLIDADDVDNHIVGSVNLSGCPTINAILIPEDATNGDVIKMILPFVEVIENEHGVFINIQNVLLDKDWWNAKYKVESSKTEQGLAYADQETMMPAT